jgi:molecular chaperone GrpE
MGCSMVDDHNDVPEQEESPAGTGTETGQPAPAPLGPDEQKKRYDELKEQYLRLAADFDNFRKRSARERETILQFANERFAVDLLEVMDNFDRAARADDASLREGLARIRELCSAVLQRHGITPISVLTKKFDPAEHEAIAHLPSEYEEGVVIDEVARGYRMHERVIRFAKVAVSKGNKKNYED